MPVLFNLLESSKQKVGLYGGTALNKIYFGKRQRLSYDIDLFCYDFKSTVKLLEANGAVVKLLADVRAEFGFNGIRLDLWAALKIAEEPMKRQANSILSFFDYPLVSQFVPSYSLEFLLAQKIVTMSSRNLIRDIYDAWVGLELVKDRRKFERYLDKAEVKADIDARKAFKDIIMRNPEYYKGKEVDAISSPPAEEMIKDIARMLEIE
jgi:predicted nucleotidyltransferase component of viral defense system